MKYSKIHEEKEDPRIDISEFYNQYKDDQGYIYFEPTIDFSFMSHKIMNGIYEIICFKSPEPGRNYKTYPFYGKGDDFDVVFNYYYISDGKEEVVKATKSIKVLNNRLSDFNEFVEHLLEKIKERYPEFWEGKKFNFFESRILSFEMFEMKKFTEFDLKSLIEERENLLDTISKFWNGFINKKEITFEPPIKCLAYIFLGMKSDDEDIYVRTKSPSGNAANSLDSMNTEELKDLLQGLQERYPEYFESEKFNFF